MKVLKTDNTQLRTDNVTIKDENKQLMTDNATMKDENKQLMTDNATMKDEVGQLTTLLDKMVVNNENQMQQIISQSSEIAIMKDEIRQLKVS